MNRGVYRYIELPFKTKNSTNMSTIELLESVIFSFQFASFIRSRYSSLSTTFYNNSINFVSMDYRTGAIINKQ